MIFDLLFGSLVVWRVSSLFSSERGPGDIFVKIRTLFKIQHDDHGFPEVWPPTFFAEVLVCKWCLSIWVGIFYTLLWSFQPQIVFYLGLPFALSAGCLIVERIANG